MNRLPPILLLLCAGSLANASFEMMLITDPYGDEIHRYDVENHIYLGSFGTGQLNNPDSIAVDQSSGTAYVYDSGLIARFNVYTGRYLGSSNLLSGMNTVRQMSVTPDGNLMVTDGAIVRKIDANSGATMLTIPPYVNNLVSAAYQRPNGNIWMVTSNAGLNGIYITRHSAGGAQLGFSTIKTNATNNAGTFGFGGMDFRDNYVAITAGYYSPGGNQYSSFSGTFTEGGGVSVTEHFFPLQANRQLVSNPVFGHSSHAYHMQLTINNGTSYSYLMTDNPITRSETAYYINEPLQGQLPYGGYGSIAFINAPEPASMTALALGAAVLARRRKRA